MLRRLLAPVVALAMLLPLSCRRQYESQVGGPGQAIAVGVAKVEARDVPLELQSFGQVEAYSQVDVKSQITGVLQEVFFTEGQPVSKGQKLVQIDPRPLEAALKEAQANRERDAAQLTYLQSEQHRFEELAKIGGATPDEIENVRAQVKAQEARIQAGEAAIESAKVQLSYTLINSPIDAVAGKLQVSQGNLVKLNDVTLVTLTQIEPIYVTFTLPQRYLDEVRRLSAGSKLEVRAAPPQDPSNPLTGELTFINNQVDVQTGTITLRATFANTEKRLWPGQFVDVTLILRMMKGALVVPSPAIQSSQQGQFVFVVQPDMTVRTAAVRTGPQHHTLTIIESGLEAGQTVVTDGQLRLTPGAKVSIKAPVATASAPAESAPAPGGY